MAYLLIRLSPGVAAGSAMHLDLAAGAITGFNIVILLAWASFGLAGGIAVSVLSLLIVSWISAHWGFYDYYFIMLSYLISISAGYIYWRAAVRRERFYNLKSEKLGEEMNLMAGHIMEKTRGIFSLKEKLKRYAALKEVIESISTHLSLDELSRLIVDNAVRTLGKPGRAMLFLVDTEKQALMLLAAHGDAKVLAKTGDVFDHWVLRHRKSLIVEDISRDFRFSADDMQDSQKIFKSLIVTPLVSESKVIGILRVDNAHADVEYNQDDLRLLDIIADLGALTIQNALLYSKTQELAIKDSLTDLFIRRYFMARLAEEIKRAARKKGELSILILDIDHFKDYNDRYGHLAGDLVLRHLSKTVRSLVKEGDIVARLGGEEIIVLLCGRNKEKAVDESERIRKAVKEKPLTLRRHEANITVSIGVSSYPEDAVLEEELLQAADKRLYSAKRGGRDRVCSE